MSRLVTSTAPQLSNQSKRQTQFGEQRRFFKCETSLTVGIHRTFMLARYEVARGKNTSCQCSFFRHVISAQFGQYFCMAEEWILDSATGAHENSQLV